MLENFPHLLYIRPSVTQYVLEYRAIRSLAAAQRMLKAGYTALLDPACAGLVTPALRDALFVGLFQGPRITSAGPALTSRQGLYDYFPSWIGVPPCSTWPLVPENRH